MVEIGLYNGFLAANEVSKTLGPLCAAFGSLIDVPAEVEVKLQVTTECPIYATIFMQMKLVPDAN